MKRQEIEEKITSYLLGDLSPEEAEEIRGLLEVSPGSRALAQELEQTLDLVRGALAADFPVPEKLSTDRKATIREAVKPAPLIWFTRNYKILAQAAAVVALIGSLAVVSKVFRVQNAPVHSVSMGLNAAEHTVASAIRYDEEELSRRLEMDTNDDQPGRATSKPDESRETDFAKYNRLVNQKSFGRSPLEEGGGESVDRGVVDKEVSHGGAKRRAFEREEKAKGRIDARVELMVEEARIRRLDETDMKKQLYAYESAQARYEELENVKDPETDANFRFAGRGTLGVLQEYYTDTDEDGLSDGWELASLSGEARAKGPFEGDDQDEIMAASEFGDTGDRFADDLYRRERKILKDDALISDLADLTEKEKRTWYEQAFASEAVLDASGRADWDESELATSYEQLQAGQGYPSPASKSWTETSLTAGATVEARFQEWDSPAQHTAEPAPQSSEPLPISFGYATGVEVAKSPAPTGGRRPASKETNSFRGDGEREEGAKDSALGVPFLGDSPLLGYQYNSERGAVSRRSNVQQDLDWDAVPNGVGDYVHATDPDDDSAPEVAPGKSLSSHDEFMTGEIRGKYLFTDKAEAEDLPANESAARISQTAARKPKRMGLGSVEHGLHAQTAESAPVDVPAEPIGGIPGDEISGESSGQKDVLSQNAVGYVKVSVTDTESLGIGYQFLAESDENREIEGMEGWGRAKESETDEESGVQPEAVIGDLALVPNSKLQTREGAKKEAQVWSNPNEVGDPGVDFFYDNFSGGGYTKFELKQYSRPTGKLESGEDLSVEKKSEIRDDSLKYRSLGRLAVPEVEGEPTMPPVFKPAAFNPYIETAIKPLSTFSIDVDTAAYTLARKYMNSGSLPPPEAVRTEEFVNFFDYDYSAPKRQTFEVYTTVARTPFTDGELLKIGVKGRRLGREEERPAVLTFVIDSSGSMDTPDRLGLVKASLKKLVSSLAARDRVAIVQVDSRARLVLPHVDSSDTNRIFGILDTIQCSGSTHLEEGITLGYDVARKGFQAGSENRVLILSDGVANLGADSAEQILNRVEESRRQGITCSVFGFGIGTYDDVMLEELADKGDGVYRFIDSEEEAHRVFVDELAAAMQFIAKDVKIQVDFDPERVRQYRQVGYENRALKDDDFRNDSVDAGEVGSGQSVTALYEILPGDSTDKPIGVVRVRYRNYGTGEIEEIAHAISRSDVIGSFEETDPRFRLAVAAAEFAEILRDSPYAADSTVGDVADVLRPVAMELGLDQHVQELMQLVQLAGGLPRPDVGR
jgi:Ca-activated chloride channel family protein